MMRGHMRVRISQKDLNVISEHSAERDFLNTLNCKLAEDPPVEARIGAPVLFVAGAPRSGTTLLAQALCGYFNLGFVDNLAARFWRAPATGLRLSRSVFGVERVVDARSEYGRTTGANIHGFHSYWMELLRLTWVDDLFEDPTQRGVDWNYVGRSIAAIQNEADRAFLFKGYYPAYFMSQICALSPFCVFVVIERDPVDQALSILEARKSEMANINDWWSMQPPEFYRLVSRSVEEQIAGQIQGLVRYFRKQAEVCGARCIVTNYDVFCTDPKLELERIGKSISSITGKVLSKRGGLPQIALSRRRGKQENGEILERLRTALTKTGS
jgi:hypothetical protein